MFGDVRVRIAYVRRRLALGVAMFAGSLRAAPADARTFDVEYSAPEACPQKQDFIAQVAARAKVARQEAQASLRFVLTIVDTTEGPRGALVIPASDGSRSIRDLPGQDCASVVEAAALITALVLDPHADARPLDKLLAPDPPALTPAKPALETVPAPSAPPVQLDASKPPTEPPTAPLEPVAKDRVAARDTNGRIWQLGFAVAPTVQGAIAPVLTPGGSLGVRLGDSRASVVAPMLGIDGMFSMSNSARTPAGGASFTWMAARAWACPIRWPSRPAEVGLRPCGFFDAGVLRGAGEDAFDSQERSAPWFAAGAVGRVEWLTTDLLALEAQAGALFPLSRDRFLFLPDTVVHEIPPVAFVASVGAAIWLP